MKTKQSRCLFTTVVVQLVICFELTESKCEFSGNPGVKRTENIVAISWRGAVKDGNNNDEYIVEFCRKQASYYLLFISTTYLYIVEWMLDWIFSFRQKKIAHNSNSQKTK